MCVHERDIRHSGSGMEACAGFLVFSLLIQPRGCDKWPALAPDCNMAASADAWLLGPQHLYPYSSCRRMDPPCEHFDPEVGF